MSYRAKGVTQTVTQKRQGKALNTKHLCQISSKNGGGGSSPRLHHFIVDYQRRMTTKKRFPRFFPEAEASQPR